MKKIYHYLFLILISYPQLSWAWKAKISVLEAPLFQKPNQNSKIVQYLRRGEEIKIYPKKEKKFFWKTIDKNGNDSFILDSHIQVYFNDKREFSFKKRKDNTDYRLEEPLPNKYPFSDDITQRGIFLVGLASPIKGHYPYTKPIAEESFGNHFEMDLIYSKKVEIDKFERSQFGTIFNIGYSSSKFKTSDKYASNEFNWELGLGPYISYDALRNKSINLSFAFALSIGYIQRVVSISDKNIKDNVRPFTGFNIEPRIMVNYTKKNFFKSLNWVISGQLKTKLPFSLTSSSLPEEFTSLWSHQDSIESGIQNQILISFGISNDF